MQAGRRLSQGSFVASTVRAKRSSAATGTPTNETKPFRSLTSTRFSDVTLPSLAVSAFSVAVLGFRDAAPFSLLVAAVICSMVALSSDFVPSGVGMRSLSSATGRGGGASGAPSLASMKPRAASSLAMPAPNAEVLHGAGAGGWYLPPADVAPPPHVSDQAMISDPTHAAAAFSTRPDGAALVSVASHLACLRS